MYNSIEVDVWTLKRAEQLWLEQAQGAELAAHAVADAGTAGFDPAVSADVQAFLTSWSTVAQQISANVEAVATGLNEFRNAFGQFEVQTTATINAWGYSVTTDLP